MPLIFFLLSCAGALATVLALVRVRHPAQLSFPVLMVAWPTGEWPFFHIAWQAVASAVFMALGALDRTIGQVAMALTVLSWLGLVGVHLVARRTRPSMESAFAASLGDNHLDRLSSEVRASLRQRPPRGLERLPFYYDRTGIVIDHDRAYGEDPKRHLVDIYRLAGARRKDHDTIPTGGAPVVLQVHGGGWIIGNKQQQGQPLLHRLAKQGYVAVAMNYRLSPKARFPDHIIDVKRAIGWIRDNIAEYGGDPDRIFITGGSAGGHLASLAALTANEARFQPGFTAVDTTVMGAIPFYGPADFRDRYDIRGYARMEPFLSRMVMPCGLDEDPDLWALASPIEQIRSDAPPFLIIQGANDVLVWREETRRFAQELAAVSTQPVVYWEVPGAQHAFDTFNSYRAAVAVDAVDLFLAEVLAARAATG